MITVNCPKCGAASDIDEKREESIVCKHCKTVITLEKAAPEKYKELKEAREKQEQRYKNILKEYESGNDSLLKNAMHKVISSTDNDDFNINRWFDFIFDAVNIGIKKKDTTNLEILKAHARRFDDAFSDYNAGDRRLYDSLVFLHPEILNEVEWKSEFEKADKADARLLQNNIIKCVKEKKDPKLLISVLNVLSASPDQFKDIGEEFLNTILDDEEIAKILSESFFKKAKGGNFAKKLKKYVSSTFKLAEVILKDTLVWNNAEKVQKQKKTQRIIVFSSVTAVIAGLVVAFFLLKNAIVMSTVELVKPEGNAIIKMVYSEKAELSGYKITYEERDGTKVSVDVTPDMLSGYDSEKIGQQDAVVTFKGKTFAVKIDIQKRQLAKTTVRISDNKLVWDKVENADGYDIYLTEKETSQGEVKYATVEDKTGDAVMEYNLVGVKDMGNEFYATVVARSSTGKYSESERAAVVKVTKLSIPDGITYEGGKLKWNAVNGADHFTVELNGVPILNVKANEQELTLKPGDNTVRVTAFPSGQNVIMSEFVTVLHKLSPVTKIEYSGNILTWESESQSNRYTVYINGEKVGTVNGTQYSTAEITVPGVYDVTVESASSSLDEINSEKYTQKVNIGTRLNVSAGKINWAALSGSSYDVYVNGEAKFSRTTEDEKNVTDLISGAGAYEIYVVVNGNIVSETITVEKLIAPTLSVENQVLKTGNLKETSYELKVDDVPYSGSISELLSTFSEAKEYKITAVNKAEKVTQIDSDVAEIRVRRLAAPTVTVSGGEVYVNSELFDGQNAAVKLYYSTGGEITSVTLISAGKHQIYAKIVATEGNQLDSADSTVIEVTKLAAPVLSYEKSNKTLTCTSVTPDKATLVYYRNGTVWNPDEISNLTGTNSIIAKYEATVAGVINSNPSNVVEITVSDINVELVRQGTSVIAKLSKGYEGLKYDIKFEWKENGVPKSSSWTNKEFKGTTSEQTCAIKTSATDVKVTVTIQGSDEVKTATLPEE